MTEQEDIDELKAVVKELSQFKQDIEIERKVSAIVKMRCAAAYASILGFVSFIAGIITYYSDIAKEAATAAVRVILTRLWQ
jgi:hypothetical protein